jgi:hypothetical protein
VEKLRKYPLLYGLGVILLLSAGGFFWYHSASPQKVKSVGSMAAHSISDPDLELVVSSFLNQLVAGHIQEAQAYTTGDTFKVLASNQQQSKDLHSNLLNQTLAIRFSNGQVAQVEVDATVQTPTHKDRNHYLYSLIKVDQWKIYKIEEIPLTMQGESKGKGFEIPSVISSYLSEVSKGNWKGAMDDLTGQALQEVQKTVAFLPKHLSENVQIQKQTPMMVSPGQALVLVEYQLAHPDQKKSQLKTMFGMEQVDGDWKISQITNVEEKDE